TFNDWTIGLALANSPDLGEEGSNANLTIGGKLGAANIGLSYAQNEDTVGDKTNKIVLAGSFEVGAATEINGYIVHDEAEAEEMAYGIGASHDLGGGASI